MALTVAVRRPAPVVSVVLAAWFVAALAVSAAGVIGRLPVPPPAVAGLLTAATLLVLSFADRVRNAVLERGPAPLVALHLVRFVGIYFLFLHSRGALPGEFAIPAGWGDIAVAASAAVVLLACIPVNTPRRRLALLAWNVFGLIDILLVVGTAMRMAIAGEDVSMFGRLPLALLPTFIVPLIVSSHVLLFVWLRRAGRAG